MSTHSLPASFAPGRLTGRQFLIIIVYGLLVLVPGVLPSTALLSAHEVLAAQPAREMLSEGHWVIQYYAGVPRYEKPPTTSWLIAAAMAVFRTDSEWAVRLPSVIAGISASLAIAALAARWLGGFTGTLAALVQLTTVWLQTQTTLAEADIHLVLWITMAMAMFALGNVPHPSGIINTRLVRCAFMVSLGLLFLFKGPVPLLFAVLATVMYIVLRRQWNAWRFFADPVAIAIFLAFLTAWPIAAVMSDPAVIPAWKQEIFGYTGAETFGRKSWSLYLLNLPVMLLPWLPLLVPTTVAAIQRRWWNRPFAVLLICWFIPGMCMLQWAAYKSAHYAFPLLPPFSIAMAAGLVVWARQQQEREIINRRLLAAVIVLAAGGGMIAAAMVKPGLPRAIPMILGSAGIGLLLAVYLEGRQRAIASIAALFVTVAGAIIAVNLAVVPAFKAEPSRKEFAQRVNQRMGNTKLHLLDFSTDDMVWYLRMPLERLDDPTPFFARPLPPEGVIVLVRGRTISELQKHYAVEPLDQPLARKSDMKGEESRVPILVRLRPATSPRATTQRNPT